MRKVRWNDGLAIFTNVSVIKDTGGTELISKLSKHNCPTSNRRLQVGTRIELFFEQSDFWKIKKRCIYVGFVIGLQPIIFPDFNYSKPCKIH